MTTRFTDAIRLAKHIYIYMLVAAWPPPARNGLLADGPAGRSMRVSGVSSQPQATASRPKAACMHINDVHCCIAHHVAPNRPGHWLCMDMAGPTGQLGRASPTCTCRPAEPAAARCCRLARCWPRARLAGRQHYKAAYLFFVETLKEAVIGVL